MYYKPLYYVFKFLCKVDYNSDKFIHTHGEVTVKILLNHMRKNIGYFWFNKTNIYKKIGITITKIK